MTIKRNEIKKSKMATEFKLPELGENIESADIVNVLVKAGDIVEKEQSIIEIETDKATIEVPSNVSGKITEILVKQGESVKVGQTIIKVDEAGDTKVTKSEPKAEVTAATKMEVKTTEKEVKLVFGKGKLFGLARENQSVKRQYRKLYAGRLEHSDLRRT